MTNPVDIFTRQDKIRERSKLGKLIAARERHTHEVEVQGYFAMGREVRRVAIRVPRKREQDAALASAHAYVTKMAERGVAAASDPEFLQDAKAAAIVAECFLDPSDDMLPLWPSVEVASEDMTPDEVGVMVRHLNEVRVKFGPVPLDIDDARVEAFATVSGRAAHTDVPEDILTPLPHEYLVHLYALTAYKLVEERRQVAVLAGLLEQTTKERDAQQALLARHGIPLPQDGPEPDPQGSPAPEGEDPPTGQPGPEDGP